MGVANGSAMQVHKMGLPDGRGKWCRRCQMVIRMGSTRDCEAGLQHGDGSTWVCEIGRHSAGADIGRRGGGLSAWRWKAFLLASSSAGAISAGLVGGRANSGVASTDSSPLSSSDCMPEKRVSKPDNHVCCTCSANGWHRLSNHVSPRVTRDTAGTGEQAVEQKRHALRSPIPSRGAYAVGWGRGEEG